jgi:hypothetical protein
VIPPEAACRRATRSLRIAIAVAALAACTPAARSPAPAATVSCPEPGAPPAPPPAAPPVTAAPIDPALALEMGRLAGRCEVSDAWLSPDGSELAICTVGAGEDREIARIDLEVYDARTGFPRAHHHLSSPLDLAQMKPRYRWSEWKALARYAQEEDRAHPKFGRFHEPPERARGEGLVIRYVDPVLTVTDEGGRTLARSSFPSWAIAGGDDGCSAASADPHAKYELTGIIQRAWGSRAGGVFVLRLVGENELEQCGGRLVVARLPIGAGVNRPSSAPPTTPR